MWLVQNKFTKIGRMSVIMMINARHILGADFQVIRDMEMQYCGYNAVSTSILLTRARHNKLIFTRLKYKSNWLLLFRSTYNLIISLTIN